MAKRFMILLQKEFRELVRSRKLLIGLAVFLFFSLMSPFTARYMHEIMGMMGVDAALAGQIPEPEYTDAMAQLVKNLGQIGLFVMIFLTAGMVVQEKERGTAAFLMVKPVSRGAFLMAKYAVLLIFTVILMLVSLVVCGFYTGILFGVYPWGALAAVCASLGLYMAVILGITLLMSTLVKSAAAAGILFFCCWLLISLLSNWSLFGGFLPGSLVGEMEGLIFGMVPDWRPFAGSVVLAVAVLAGSVMYFCRWEDV